MSAGELLDLPRHPGLRVASIAGKGRGLVTIEPIGKGVLIEVAPVLPLPPEHSPSRDNPVFDYPFAWDEPPFAEAIAFGVMSMLNHSDDANGLIERDYANRAIRLVAARDIEAGEEITIDYAIAPWWETPI